MRSGLSPENRNAKRNPFGNRKLSNSATVTKKKSNMIASPTQDSFDVNQQQQSLTNDTSKNTNNISHYKLQEHLQAKKGQMMRKNIVGGNEKKQQLNHLFLSNQQRFAKKNISPLTNRVNWAKTKKMMDNMQTQRQFASHQNDPKYQTQNKAIMKRNTLQYYGKSVTSNHSQTRQVSKENLKQRKTYNFNVSDGGRGGGDNSSQKNGASKNLLGSIYGQQSIGPGSMISLSDCTPNQVDRPSPGFKRKTTVFSQGSGHSSYSKFKNYLYNTVQTAKVNYHSKTCMNLKDKQFFQPTREKEVKTVLLNKTYKNKRNMTAQELEQLNQRFIIDWRGITWFSYRDQIERPIGTMYGEHSSVCLRSDHGWGCMLRTGQMILFQALLRHQMKDLSFQEICKDAIYRQKYFDILKLFMDNSPGDDYDSMICPFGIHSISREAKKYLKMDAGQWFGPQRISLVLKNICNNKMPVSNFKIHVCTEGYIFLDDIEKLLKQNNSVLVLMPIMVGANKISQTYLKQVKFLFQINQTVGMMGGKDRMAIYLIGDENVHSDNSGLFYLDPHFVQNAVPSQELDRHFIRNQQNSSQNQQFYLSPEYLDTYHTYDLRTIDPSNMQTSIAPGFYLRDIASFKTWVQQIKDMHNRLRDQCIFSIYDTKPQWMKDVDSNLIELSEPQEELENGTKLCKDSLNFQVEAIDSEHDSFEDLKDFDFAEIEQQANEAHSMHKKLTLNQRNLTQQFDIGQSTKNYSYKHLTFTGRQKLQVKQNPTSQMNKGPRQQVIRQQQTQMEPANTKQFVVDSSQDRSKSGNLCSSSFSRESPQIDFLDSDIDKQIIKIGGTEFLDVQAQDSHAKAMPRVVKSSAMPMQQTQITNIESCENNQGLQAMQPGQRSIVARQVLSQQVVRPLQREESKVREEKHSEKAAAAAGRQSNAQVIGPRTMMMNLTQGKSPSKIKSMQQSGMIEPKSNNLKRAIPQVPQSQPRLISNKSSNKVIPTVGSAITIQSQNVGQQAASNEVGSGLLPQHRNNSTNFDQHSQHISSATSNHNQTQNTNNKTRKNNYSRFFQNFYKKTIKQSK